MKIHPIANYINNHRSAQSILKKVDKNPALYNAITAFTLAGVARPSLIGIMPFKDKKDKQYSQGSAIAAGTVELAATAALFMPLNKSIAKASENLYNTKDTFFYQNAPALRQFKSVTNRGIKALSLIPISLLRFGLVKPIVDFIFGRKNESK